MRQMFVVWDLEFGSWVALSMLPGPTSEYECVIMITSPKTNMEPQNGGLEDDFPFQRADFQVLC